MLRKIIYLFLAALAGKVLYNPVLPQDVTVYSRVGGYVINSLEGLASPFAEVTLNSQGLVRKTTASETGEFAFYYIPAPENLGELCLVAQDVNQLPTFPLCLAPPPPNRDVVIKNVFLPPTISLQSQKIPVGKTAKASGMTIPNSEVDVYLFTENQSSIFSLIVNRYSLTVNNKRFTIHDLRLTNIIKTAYAVGLPKYRVRSNANGYFEFSLPASFPSNNGIFATIKGSPKSNTLFFQTLGWWEILKLFLENFFKAALAFFVSIKSSPARIILLEILALTGLIILVISRKRRAS